MSLSVLKSSPYENVLYIGPGYKNHRGGIGAVLDIYSKNIEPFNFISTYSYKNKFRELFYFSGSVLKLFGQLLTNRKIKIVHVHGAKDGSIVRKYAMVFIAKKIFGKKIVYHSHAPAFDENYNKRGRFYKYICRLLINNSEAVVVLSEIWNQFYLDTFRVKKLLVINNPVEHKQAEAVKTVTSSSPVTFLFLGALGKRKGIFDLVGLVTAEQQALRGKLKLLVGGDQEVDRLKKAIADGGISDIVEYIGWVQGEEKHRLFDACDYFILPAYHEALPMAILEAFSHGKPVISTTVGGIPDVVDHSKNGYLFTPGNMDQLKKIIFDVINDRSNYSELEKNAKKTATRFYPESIKSELEKLYSEII